MPLTGVWTFGWRGLPCKWEQPRSCEMRGCCQGKGWLSFPWVYSTHLQHDSRTGGRAASAPSGSGRVPTAGETGTSVTYVYHGRGIPGVS